MGSPCEIQLRGGAEAFNRDLAARLEREISRLEQAYSRFLPDSLVARINRAAGSGDAVAVDEETDRLLDYAETCFEQSGGLFDITSGSLRRLWNYQALEEQQVLPTTAALEAALALVGWDKVRRYPGRVYLPLAGMEIDFGGIVKEYAADCVAALAQEAGVGSGMVELGGDIRVFGTDKEPEPWQVGVRDPFHTDRPCALISLMHGALATSGDYERYTVIQGHRYSHILNPLTGWPVAGFSSVSVVAYQCTVAGSAASIAVLKEGDGEAWLQALGLPYLCIDPQGGTTGTLAV